MSKSREGNGNVCDLSAHKIMTWYKESQSEIDTCRLPGVASVFSCFDGVDGVMEIVVVNNGD